MEAKQKSVDSNKNALYNLVFSIVLPVVILNKAGNYFGENGPLVALILAISLPVGYFIYDYRLTKKANAITILGFVNVLATGGLAFMKIEGIWFAVKEGIFPLIIGIAVYLSSKWKNPLIKALLFNDQIFDVDKIQSHLNQLGTVKEFDSHLRKSTKYFAYTFYLSAILNFVLASYIFTEIPKSLADMERSQILNQQIADMTWKSYIVIVIPSMLCMFILLNYLVKGIHKFTGMGFQEVIKQTPSKSTTQ